MAFKPDHGLLEGMGGWKNKAISVVILEIKQKEVVFGNSAALSHATWNSDHRSWIINSGHKQTGSPHVVMRFLTLTVKYLNSRELV